MIDPSLSDGGSVLGRIVDGSLAECRPAGTTRRAGPPLRSTTTFDAASLSKPVFARWVIELSLRGELDLAAPIELDPDEVGAEPDPRLRAITPAMALSHSVGFPNWREPGRPLRLLAEPGARIIYSGEGFEYLLAALRLQRGARQVERELEELLARLGMDRSSFVEAKGEEAVGHTADGECASPAPRRPLRAAGSLHTSLEDYSRFLIGTFWADDDQARRTARLMSTVSIGSRGDARTLGWASAGAILWQNGDNPGFKHLVVVDPRDRRAVVVLTNADSGIELVRRVGEEAGVPARHRDGYSSECG